MAKHKRAAVSESVVGGLLQDIKANPDEDGPRLILADYLEEQGEPRGEFIHLQCQLASLEEDDPDRETLASRAWEIARAHRDEWLGPLQYLHPRCRFTRGLVALEADCPTVVGPTLSAAAQQEPFNWVEKLDLDIHDAQPEAVT